MHKIKEMLMKELYEYEEKAKKINGGKLSAGDLETIHKLTDTVKNIDKIEMLEEDDGYSCSKCWNEYCGCIVWCCKGIYNCCVGIKNCFVNCCSTCWYPCKERCSNSCDNCDKDMHPYKDPEHNPYDYI